MGAIRTEFIRAPIGGLNLVTDPANLDPTEARVLDNYYVYDQGIRERGATTRVFLPGSAADYPVSMLSFSSTTYANGAWIICGVNKIWKWDGTTFTQINTDPNNIISDMFAFNKRIFMCDALTAEIHSYTLSTDAYADTSFTGGPSTPITGFAFKSRAYIIGRGDSNFYYIPGAPGVAAVAGGLTPYDVGQFFQRGSGLLWGTSWPYNQGLTNDELFVVGNDAGEVFIYSGDSPDNPNWQLVARVDIPSPLTAIPGASGLKVPVLKLGQDILIGTNRGIVSLQKVLAGRKDTSDEDYYTISQNLGYVFSWHPPAISSAYPFAYFGSSTNGEMFVLNYERGVWSKFKGLGPTALNGMSVQAPPLYGNNSSPGGISLVLIADRSGGFWKLNEGATVASAATTYTWTTPYFNFGYPLQKSPTASLYKSQLDLLKTQLEINVLTRDMASTSVSNSVQVYSDFEDSPTTAPTASVATDTRTDTSYKRQLLNPPAVPGVWLSYKFSKTGSGTAQNEIAGFSTKFEELAAVR